MPGVGVEAAREIEGEQRAGVARGERICAFDQRGVVASRGAAQADAEQAVDDQVPARGRRDVRLAGAAGGDKAAIRRGGIGGEFVGRGGKHDADLEMTGAQLFGDDEGIAAVIARSGEDEDAPADGEGFGPGRGRAAGARHQRTIGVRGFENAQGRAAVERQGGGVRHGGWMVNGGGDVWIMAPRVGFRGGNREAIGKQSGSNREAIGKRWASGWPRRGASRSKARSGAVPARMDWLEAFVSKERHKNKAQGARKRAKFGPCGGRFRAFSAIMPASPSAKSILAR